jgi:DNA polymerase-3 subunit beta
MYKVLQVVAKALPVATPMLDLMNFLFEVSENRVQISATNLKTYIASSVKIEADEKFEFIVQGSVLLETMQALNSVNGEQIIFERMTNGQLSLSLEKSGSNFALNARDVLEYPKVSLLQPEISFSLKGEELRSLFRMGYIASLQTDESSLGYRGTCVDLKNGFISVISFDGNRLAKAARRMSGLSPDINRRWIMSLDACSELLKILPDSDVEVCCRENQLLLRFDNTVFQTMLNQTNRFDDIEDYFPEEEPEKVLVDVREFLSHLKVLNPISKEIDNRIFFAIENRTLKLKAFSDKRGEASTEFTIECREDFTASVGLNGKFVADFLNAAESERACFSIYDSDTPAYLWSESNNEDKSDMYILSSLSIVG